MLKSTTTDINSIAFVVLLELFIRSLSNILQGFSSTIVVGTQTTKHPTTHRTCNMSMPVFFFLIWILMLVVANEQKWKSIACNGRYKVFPVIICCVFLISSFVHFFLFFVVVFEIQFSQFIFPPKVLHFPLYSIVFFFSLLLHSL